MDDIKARKHFFSQSTQDDCNPHNRWHQLIIAHVLSQHWMIVVSNGWHQLRIAHLLSQHWMIVVRNGWHQLMMAHLLSQDWVTVVSNGWHQLKIVHILSQHWMIVVSNGWHQNHTEPVATFPLKLPDLFRPTYLLRAAPVWLFWKLAASINKRIHPASFIE